MRTKLKETSEECVLVGCTSMPKDYRLYNLKTKKIIISRDMVFDEKATCNWQEKRDEKTVPTTIMYPINVDEQTAHSTPNFQSSTSSPFSPSSSFKKNEMFR